MSTTSPSVFPLLLSPQGAGLCEFISSAVWSLLLFLHTVGTHLALLGHLCCCFGLWGEVTWVRKLRSLFILLLNAVRQREIMGQSLKEGKNYWLQITASTETVKGHSNMLLRLQCYPECVSGLFWTEGDLCYTGRLQNSCITEQC